MDILLIDDDEAVRRSLARGLEQSGFRVETARNGQDAMERFDLRSWGAIVCDVVMPRLDGRRFYHWLAQAYPQSARRLVFVTAWAHEPWVQRFLADAPAPVLEKPFDLTALEALVKQVAGQDEPAPAEGRALRETPVSFSAAERDEIRRAMAEPGVSVACPRCGELLELSSVKGAAGGTMWELRCHACRRSMLVKNFPGPATS